jgi:hypothetical protein
MSIYRPAKHRSTNAIFPAREKRGQVPIVRSTLRAIRLLVPDPFFRTQDRPRYFQMQASAATPSFQPIFLPSSNPRD